MKNKSKILKNSGYFLLVLLFGTMVSCTDVLDKGPLGTINGDIVWTDQSLVDAFMANMYDRAQLIPSAENFRNRLNQETFAETTLSDEGRARNTNDSYNYVDGRVSATSTNHVLGIWDGHWNYLRNLNLAIEKMSDPESTLDESYREQRLGELYFLRANANFRMVKRYGGIPLITEVQDVNADSESLKVPRSTEAATYDFIGEDLDRSIDLLKDKVVTRSHISHWAALTLKSRAMLYAGSIAANNSKLPMPDPNGLVGIDPSKAQGYYQKSLAASKALMPAPYGAGTAPFALMPGSTTAEYRKIFYQVESNNDSESIMTFEYTGPDARFNELDVLNLPRASAAHVNWGCAMNTYFETALWFDYKDGTPGDQLPVGYPDNGSHLLANNVGPKIFHNLTALWGNKDPRFDANIAYPGFKVGPDVAYFHKAVVDGAAADAAGVPRQSVGQNRIRSAMSPFKTCTPEDPTVVYLEGNKPITIFRFSEIYLNYAEAAFGLGDPTGLAALNKIRARVSMPLRTELNMDVIMKERQIELFFENHRYWDLKRWRVAEAPLSKSYQAVDWTFDVANNKFAITLKNGENVVRHFKPQDYYLPIPLTEIQTNNALVQNPGFEL